MAVFSSEQSPRSVYECLVYDFSKQIHVLRAAYWICQNPVRRLIFYFRLIQLKQNSRIWRSLLLSLYRRLQYRLGCEINVNAKIGPRLRLPHPNGVVIGDGVTVGSDVVIFQQVTLGAKKRGDGNKAGMYPTIGNRAVLYAGAKLLGSIKVGDDAQVGANAVVLHDVPNNSVAVGIPAKILGNV